MKKILVACGTAIATSTVVAKKLETAALAGIKSPRMQQAMKEGEVTGTLDATGFAARLDHDVAFWGPMIKKLGIPMAD